MVRHKHLGSPVAELVSYFNWRRKLGIIFVGVLAFLEVGGLATAILQLWFWPLVLAALAHLLNRFYGLWLLGQIRVDLSCALLKQLLRQEFASYLQDDPSAQAGRLVANLDEIQNNVLSPLLHGSIGIIRIIAIIVLLSIFGSYQGMRIGLSLVVVQGIAGFLVSPYLRFYSAQLVRCGGRRARLLADVLGSFQEILLSGSESFFVSGYQSEVRQLTRYKWLHAVLLSVPLILTSFLALALLLLVPWTAQLSPVGLVPGWLIGSLVVSALVWVLNDLFLSSLRLQAALPGLQSLLWSTEAVGRNSLASSLDLPPDLPLSLRQRIRLNHVAYRYPGRTDFALKGLSLMIPVGSRVALVGPSGSGKTTAARILLGLLRPTAGCVEVDGAAIAAEDLSRWRSSCAFVPQQISLLNASVKANVAFGLPVDAVDDSAVWEALEAASLADDVFDLPYGLMTPIGANGFQLSGGQRQRLALARAFYRNAALLVLDEATSALDGPTESSVLEALDLVARRCTTVVIAHRVSTIRRCDVIFEFDRGRVRASGTYEELVRHSRSFAGLVGGLPLGIELSQG